MTVYLRTVIVRNMLPRPQAPDLTQVKSRDVEPRKITSESLLGLGRELLIVHNGKEYRLRVTQNGKLILTA